MADKVKAAFSKYDKDKNGFVSVDEARLVFLGEMGFNEDQAERLTLIYDRDGDGRLNYNEFAGFYELITNNVQEMSDMFGRMDKDGSGHISASEIRDALAAFGFTDTQIADAVKLHDVNKDGFLQRDEFSRFWITQI